MNTWYLVKVKFTKEFADGTLKRVTEPYMVNAVSFTDAEAIIYEEVGEFIRGEFLVIAAARQEICDVFSFDDSETWWKAKVSYTTEDDNGKEKKVVNYFYVTANESNEADARIKEELKGLMSVFEVTALTKTKIVEFINPSLEKTEE